LLGYYLFFCWDSLLGLRTMPAGNEKTTEETACELRPICSSLPESRLTPLLELFVGLELVAD
jgi:hypothetical protein